MARTDVLDLTVVKHCWHDLVQAILGGPGVGSRDDVGGTVKLS